MSINSPVPTLLRGEPGAGGVVPALIEGGVPKLPLLAQDVLGGVPIVNCTVTRKQA